MKNERHVGSHNRQFRGETHRPTHGRLRIGECGRRFENVTHCVLNSAYALRTCQEPMLYKDVKRGFGLALKNWRGISGFSQEELAWRASLHRSYLADIERGARNPSLQTIEKLAKALKVSLSTLLQP